MRSAGRAAAARVLQLRLGMRKRSPVRGVRMAHVQGAARTWNSALKPSLDICGATGRRETAALVWRGRRRGSGSAIQADAPIKLRQSIVTLAASMVAVMTTLETDSLKETQPRDCDWVIYRDPKRHLQTL